MNDGAHIALLLLMLILPLSGLIVRRPPLGAALKLGLAWVVIFAVAAVLVTQVERFRGFTEAEPPGATQQVRIVRGADGHFWGDVRINGVERRMLIDTGATTTALSIGTATSAGIDIEESTFPRLIETANGQVVARTAHVERLTIGPIEARDLPVVVSEAFGDQDVIGMNFLSRLGSWRAEGDSLVLTARR